MVYKWLLLLNGNHKMTKKITLASNNPTRFDMPLTNQPTISHESLSPASHGQNNKEN